MTRKLGWESKPDEEHLTKLLRSLLLGRMAMFDDPEVIAEAERRFDLHIKGQEQVPADFRSTVYKAVLRTGSRSKYDDLLRIYREATLHEEKDRIASALGTIKNEEILKEVLFCSTVNLNHVTKIVNCFDRSWRLPCRTKCDRKTLFSSSRRLHRANSAANWPGTTLKTTGISSTSASRGHSSWSGWLNL